MRYIFFNLVPLLFSLFLSSTAGAITLGTSGAANNGNEGLMFDLQVGGQDITITSLSSRGNTAAGLLYSVYSRDGGFDGGQQDATSWILRATLLPNVAIETGELIFDIGDFSLQAESTTGIYLAALENRTPSEILYQTTTVGTVTASDDFVTILAGEGVDGLFGETVSARQLVGSVSYELNPTPIPLPATGTLLLGLLTLFGLNRARDILRR
jgi:hypothetical protein